jgi:agmatinase
LYDIIYNKVSDLIHTDKYLTFLGGEHSISIGIIEAFYEKYKNLTVLQLDAHADLREEYNGSRYNHACAMHKASLKNNLIQIGIRSMDISEKKYMNREKVFFAYEISGNSNWHEKAISLMTDKVYLTVDLDVFDSSLMPATGTPEPGGLFWWETLNFLKKVFTRKDVVAFGIVEHAPIKGLKAPDFLVAKLYYKLLSYRYYGKKR